MAGTLQWSTLTRGRVVEQLSGRPGRGPTPPSLIPLPLHNSSGMSPHWDAGLGEACSACSACIKPTCPSVSRVDGFMDPTLASRPSGRPRARGQPGANIAQEKALRKLAELHPSTSRYSSSCLVGPGPAAHVIRLLAVLPPLGRCRPTVQYSCNAQLKGGRGRGRRWTGLPKFLWLVSEFSKREVGKEAAASLSAVTL